MRVLRLVGIVREALALILSAALAPSPVQASFSQIDPAAPGSHGHFARALRRHQYETAREIVHLYELAEARTPDDPLPLLERCRFVNTRVARRHMGERTGVSHRACADRLEVLFPDDPDARVYVIEFWHYDVRRARDFLADPPPGTGDRHRARVHAYLASVHPPRPALTRRHGEKAMALDPSLDLRFLVANAWKKKDPSKARELLLTNLDGTTSWHELGRKASLLVELGEYERSLAAFRRVEKKDEELLFAFAFAEALAATGHIEEARAKYRSSGNSSDQRQLRARFAFELEHGDAANARSAYDDLVGDDWSNDAFAHYRLRLLAAHPGAEWKMRDGAGLAVLAASVAGIGFVPALFVAPVALAGRLRRRRPAPEPGAFHFRLRHVWLAEALVLVASLLPLFFWPGMLEEPAGAGSIAALTWSVVLVFAAAVAVAGRELRSMLARGRWGPLRTIGAAIALILFAVPFAIAAEQMFGTYSADELDATVKAMAATGSAPFALVCVGLLIPVAEEVVSRGIVLSGFQTRLSFGAANFAQALLFGLLHADAVGSTFAFAFGLGAGWVTRRSGSLRTSILAHSLLNSLRFAAVIYAT